MPISNPNTQQNINAGHLQPEYLQSVATGGNQVGIDGNARVAKRVTTEREQFAAFVQTVRQTNATADEQSCLGVWATLSDDVKAFFGAGGAGQQAPAAAPVANPQQPVQQQAASVTVPGAISTITTNGGVANDLAISENERKRKRDEDAASEEKRRAMGLSTDGAPYG